GGGWGGGGAGGGAGGRGGVGGGEEGGGGGRRARPPRRTEHGAVGGDEDDALSRAVLRGEPLEERVGVGCVSNGERSELHLVSSSVEDDDSARAACRDEARERVGKLARVGVRSGVQQVVAVEEVERRVSHCAAGSLRREGAGRRR